MMMRTAVLTITFLMLLSGCISTESTPTPTPTQVPNETAVPTAGRSPTAVASPTTVPKVTATTTPTAAPSPTQIPAPTPTVTPTPQPEPSVVEVTASDCCGLFNWLSADELMVFDDPEGESAGTWRVNVSDGARSYISPGYGIPSESGIIAFPDNELEQITIRESADEIVDVIYGRGIAVWPSPDGSRVAWLERLSIPTPSSSVNRAVRLYVADLQSGASRSLLELQAHDLAWLPDSRQLIVNARDLNFQQAGVWLIDVETGNVEILLEELFIRAVTLSPEGNSVAFMRSFNSNPEANGVWVMDIESREMQRLFESGSFRWSHDEEHLWRHEMGDTGAGNDTLEKISIETGEIEDRIELDGQILNEQWEVSPDGERVAYWRYNDGLVVVHALP